MDFLINYVIEYLFFDGEITILKGVLDLLSFSEPSHWNMIFLGFIIGILVRRFSNKIKSWWLLSYPIIFFVAIYPLSDTFTVYDKKNLAVSKEIVREMNYDYDQWKRKNPRGTINPEWVKELDKEKIKQYFSIKELVSPFVYKIMGEKMWSFFPRRALLMLLIIRELVDASITINNWYWGGSFTQRGFRSSFSSIVKGMFYRRKLYLSMHVFLRAFDFDVRGMNAVQVRKLILKNADIFPFKIRLEHLKNGKPISWVHTDCKHEKKNPQVYLFNV